MTSLEVDSVSQILKEYTRMDFIRFYTQLLKITKSYERGAVVAVYSSITAALVNKSDLCYMKAPDLLDIISSSPEKVSIARSMLETYNPEKEIIIVTAVLDSSIKGIMKMDFRGCFTNVKSKLALYANYMNIVLFEEDICKEALFEMASNGIPTDPTYEVNSIRLDSSDPYDSRNRCDRPGCSIRSYALKLCAGCKDALYCNKNCQAMDWVSHKPYCAEIKIIKKEMRAKLASKS